MRRASTFIIGLETCLDHLVVDGQKGSELTPRVSGEQLAGAKESDHSFAHSRPQANAMLRVAVWLALVADVGRGGGGRGEGVGWKGAFHNHPPPCPPTPTTSVHKSTEAGALFAPVSAPNGGVFTAGGGF